MTKAKEPYYNYFVLSCIILLVGIFLPERFGIHYLEFSFLYLIVLPICIVAALYFMYIKNLRKGSLYMALWTVFPDFVIVSPKILRQRVLLFSDVLPSALFGYKPPCS